MSTPKIFVFCNSCQPGWHSMLALAEDGVALAGHICSHHHWAQHDMGLNEDGLKRDLYAAHYPQGFEVEWVDNPRPAGPDGHAGLAAAIERHFKRTVAA